MTYKTECCQRLNKALAIMAMITTQNKLHAKYKRSNSTLDHKIYKEYRNKLTRTKEKAKAMYAMSLTDASAI